jgi:hypothetical protein
MKRVANLPTKGLGIEIEKTTNRNGGLFMLAGLRFAEDGRLGWTANRLAPFNSMGLARGT